jgi:hypothetical protein
MPTLSLATRPPGRRWLCDARHVSVRAGAYPQRTPHKAAPTVGSPLVESGSHEAGGRASGPAPSVPLRCLRTAVNSQ